MLRYCLCGMFKFGFLTRGTAGIMPAPGSHNAGLPITTTTPALCTPAYLYTAHTCTFAHKRKLRPAAQHYHSLSPCLLPTHSQVEHGVDTQTGTQCH